MSFRPFRATLAAMEMTEKQRKAYEDARKIILDAARRMARGARGEEVTSLGWTLASNGLVALPPEIGRLTALTRLDLSTNRLTALPPEVGQLTRLGVLSLTNNQLTALPPEIGQLTALTSLYLDGNPLTALPLEMRRLTRLERLYLHNTPLARELPENVLGPMWQEVMHKNATPAHPADILDYYFSLHRGARTLDEARVLVVGRGEAGKTSLCRVLAGQGFREGEAETAGIEIGRLDVLPAATAGKERRIVLHLWDFAGQEITYALHRFFLAQHALYLLVLDNRAGTAAQDAEDWLRTVAAYAGKAHVVVAMTKQDTHPFHLDTEKLRRRWSGKFAGMEFVRTDAKSGRGVADLRALLTRIAADMPEVNMAFPTEYESVKQRCDAMRTRGDKRLSLEQFRTLCAEHGIRDADGKTSAERADGLARILHDLGVVLHFVDDPRLKENTVLDPQWVTNGVYKLLRAREKAAEEAEARAAGAGALEAVLTVAKACAALPGESREGVLFLLRLMERFEMIYVLEDPPALAGEEDVAGCQWFMPAVLPEYQPEMTPALLPWRNPDETELRLRFTYPLLPEGLAPRFIVRTWPLNEEMPRWRTGCFLREGRAEALISAERLDRTVEITVRGPEADRVRLGRLVARHMEAIHRDVPEQPRGEILVRLDVDGRKEEAWKNIEVLEKDEAKDEKGESTVETSVGTKPLSAEEELDRISGKRRRKWTSQSSVWYEADETAAGYPGAHPKVFVGKRELAFHEGAREAIQRIRGPRRVFVSYAHRDKRVCDVLMQNLSVMEQDGLIDAWTDNLIPAGEQWDEEIKKRLAEADLFIGLVTTAFLGSKYIRDVELPMALERREKQGMKLAFILVEDRDLGDFSKYQVILPGGRAVRQWGRMQDAFNAAEKTLRQMVEAISGARK